MAAPMIVAPVNKVIFIVKYVQSIPHHARLCLYDNLIFYVIQNSCPYNYNCAQGSVAHRAIDHCESVGRILPIGNAQGGGRAVHTLHFWCGQFGGRSNGFVQGLLTRAIGATHHQRGSRPLSTFRYAPNPCPIFLPPKKLCSFSGSQKLDLHLPLFAKWFHSCNLFN